GAGRRGMSGGWRRDRSVWGRAVGGRGRGPGRCARPAAGGRALGAGRLGSGGAECRVPGAGRWWPGVAVRAMAYGRTPWLYRQRVLAYAIRRRGGPARGAGRSASGPTGPGSVVGFGVAGEVRDGGGEAAPDGDDRDDHHDDGGEGHDHSCGTRGTVGGADRRAPCASGRPCSVTAPSAARAGWWPRG